MKLLFDLNKTLVMTADDFSGLVASEGQIIVDAPEGFVRKPFSVYRLIDGRIVEEDKTPPPPTDVEVQASQARFNRAMEYPSFAEQFDLLFHGGYDAWKSQIQAVKDKYPKPTQE